MLTFAGEPLLFPGDLGPSAPHDQPKLPIKVWKELDHWLQYHLSLDDMGQFGASESRVTSGRHACRSRFEQNKGLGLPVINWPAPPPPRLNTLYWPTGATRWARGWFLATDYTVTKLLKKLHQSSSNMPGTLGIGDDIDQNTDTPVQAISMYMLPPRPLSHTSSQDVGDLFLIPLVDARYFWQFRNFGDNAVTTSTTWANLFTTLGTQLGVTISVSSSVEAAYLKPDPTDFSRRHDNAALLLDAAAWSVGRRIVRKIDGSVICQSKSIADTILTANLKLPWKQLAGWDFSQYGGDHPSSVTVAFRKMKEYFLEADNKLYTVDTDAPSGVSVDDSVLTIFCAAYADYNTSDVLQNGTDLGALATQIANDYYGWAGKDYDYSFSGILDWTPSAYDDAILWRFGSLCGDQVQAQTRVGTLPGNCWPEINLASDSTKEVASTAEILVKNTGSDIGSGGSGVCQVWTGTPGSESNSGKTVTVYNKTSTSLKSTKFGSAGYVQGQIYVTPWQQ